MKPLVSVVIPIYNRGPKVRSTIDSVLAQTLPSDQYELILIDDGSTDDTFEVLSSTYGDIPNVHLRRQENSGVAVARNRGLASARGEYVAFLDHDDFWLPEKLELQLKAFEASWRIGVVTCLWQGIDESTHGESPTPSTQLVDAPNANADSAPLPIGRVYDSLVLKNFIVSMSVPMMRTELAREAGGFDPDTVPCDDWDLWLRLARQCEFACVPRPLVLYTRHGEQQSNLLDNMREGMQKTLIKQWPHLLGRPRKLWFVLSVSSFLATGLLYYTAKQELLEGHRKRVLQMLPLVAVTHPLALLSPQWVYLLKRAITNNKEPF
jgi:glycosyltransferase involved in cell wall biosynthesis